MARRHHPRPTTSDNIAHAVVAYLAAPIISMDEAALIAKVHRRTVARWIAEDRIRSHRPIARGSGRRWIDRQSFLEFLGAGTA